MAMVIGVILVIAGVFIFIQTHDRQSGYSINLKLPKDGKKTGQLKVGFAVEKITPELPDKWTDIDSNAQYEPEKGDTYIDGNHNGKFDAFWLAGYGNKRAANGVHDDIWARAIVIDDSASVVGLVVLDAIGFFNDDVITVRKIVAERIPEIDHIIVSSTHVHEVPDLMGLWGESEFKSGVNAGYKKLVIQKAADAICAAYQNRKAALLEYAQVDSVPKDIVRDSRKPYVYDDAIRLLKVKEKENGKLMGLLVNFGSHPETADDENLLITADYVHYLRDGIERGIYYDDQKKRDGIGGAVIFMNGAIGGLQTGLSLETFDPWLNKTFTKDDCSFEKVRAQGYRLADLVLNKLEKDSCKSIYNPTISLFAKSFEFKLDNKLFKLGVLAGVIDRGLNGFNYFRSEVNLLTVGPAWFLTIPGELNAEILNGGIENPEGADFKISPVEIPPLRQMMKGDINFAIGLANDEVGYIMPKSHWDEKAPFTYGEKEAPYGEINSLGPETGPEFHKQAKLLIEEMLQKN